MFRYGYRVVLTEEKASVAHEIRRVLGESFVQEKALQEVRYLTAEGHDAFVDWFNAFLPVCEFQPTYPADVNDGKLGHLIGLNLSRAWMLRGIASKLPEGNERKRGLLLVADKLGEAGLASIRSELYQNADWLGTFAVYLMSQQS